MTLRLLVLDAYPPEGRAALAEDFVNAILTDAEPPVTGEDGKKALEIILGAYESARIDMPIDLPL